MPSYTLRRPCVSRGTRVNAVTIASMFKNALWTALRTIFRQKCTRLQDHAYAISKSFRGQCSCPLQKCPGAWIQTPISAWLASVSTVPDLRNDNCTYKHRHIGGICEYCDEIKWKFLCHGYSKTVYTVHGSTDVWNSTHDACRNRWSIHEVYTAANSYTSNMATIGQTTVDKVPSLTSTHTPRPRIKLIF